MSIHAATRGERVFYGVNYLLLAVFTLICILPFVHIVAISLSSYRAVISGEVGLFPVELTWNAYENLIAEGTIFQALWNTIHVTAVGTALSMAATVLAAYPLSKRRILGRTAMLWLVIFTMLFNGGMIPTFIVVRTYGLVNSYWSLWMLGLASGFNIFIMKTFFQEQPDSLEESAWMDGASDFTILLRIVLPLSTPVIATLTLFYAVGNWNSYMNVLIYIQEPSKYTLMLRLRQMINQVNDSLLAARSGEGTEGSSMLDELITPESIRAAAIIVATVPILLVYPFLQRYFVKGVMLGSLKG
jgi:putative aldouronate transport system permease protein